LINNLSYQQNIKWFRDIINIETLFKELTLNPSLGKRGTLGSPFSFQEKGFGDEFFNL